MLEFKLEPWECLSSEASAEPDALAEVVWRGARRVMMLRVVRFKALADYGYTFAREVGSNCVGSWLLVERCGERWEPWNRGRGERLPLESAFGGVESGEVELARFCKVEHLGLRRNAFTLSSGESVWFSVGEHYQVPFDLFLSQEEFFGDGEAHFRRLVEEFVRPDSDARFSMNWMLWSTDDEQEYLFGSAGFRELKALLRSILWSEPRIWQLADHLQWKLWEEGRGYSRFYSITKSVADTLRNDLPRLQGIAEEIVRKWPLAVSQHDLDAHRCLRESLRGNRYWPLVEVRSPLHLSAHERLEARLQLRDWLERNAPERMEELLPS